MAELADASDLKSGIHNGCAGSSPASATFIYCKGIVMWPKYEAVKVGAVFRRDWKPRRGQPRFQVRKILSVSRDHRHYEHQINDDSCEYVIVDGFRTGNKGRCNRIVLAQRDWKCKTVVRLGMK